MGQVDIFDILFDNSNGVYREGDRVSGNVKITNSEEVKYKAIKLELCGIALVQWNQADESDPDIDLDEVKGDINKEQYFQKKITLLEKDGGFLDKDPVLPAGEHSFAFDCKLPQELPSSFEGRFGQIRYMAKACIERPGLTSKVNVVTKKAFTVLNGLDLNFIPEAAVKIEICKYKQLGSCCVSGSVTIDWAVERSGFVPGEDIMIHGSVQNDSKAPVAFSRVALFMVVDYKSKKRHRRERRKIASVDKGETLPDDVTVWHDALHIPPLPPTGLSRCRLIDVSYELEFKALVEGGYSPLQILKDIYIGTVPMCRKEMKSCIAGMFNQPYTASSETLDRDTKRQSQVSLTEIIAIACTEEPKASPTAPTLATLERGGVSMSPSGHIISQVPEAGEEAGGIRPPPFAPGHTTGLDMPDGASGAPNTTPPTAAPSAPGLNTMMRPWPESPLDPTYEGTDLFGPVSLREASDDQESLRGEFTYHPVYTYYPTLRRTDNQRQPEP